MLPFAHDIAFFVARYNNKPFTRQDFMQGCQCFCLPLEGVFVGQRVAYLYGSAVFGYVKIYFDIHAVEEHGVFSAIFAQQGYGHKVFEQRGFPVEQERLSIPLSVK